MTDTAAGMAMGLAVVGRPSNTGGVDLLAELLTDLPDNVRIIVVGENDGGPGVRGAESTRAALAKRLGRHVEALLPPDNAKDTREWFNAQVHCLGDQTALLELGHRFIQTLCGLFADCLLCGDSSHIEENGVVTNRHSTTNPQCIRNQSANYNENAAWAIPKRIREKWSCSPWNCDKARGVGYSVDGSPWLICATCRKWSCPVCADYLRLKAYDRFGFHLTSFDGQIYHDLISDLDWKSSLEDMRRRAKKLGVPLCFVTIRDEAGSLTCFASVSVRADIAQPVNLSEALNLLESALDGVGDSSRPINACRAWGKLLVVREGYRVPGGCSPSAFRATLLAWKASAVGSERFIKCDRSGLFLVDGKLDEQLQCDFWREAETYGYAGAAAANETRRTLAAARERRRQGPTIDPANCFHDFQERPDPERPGWLKTSCPHCGKVLGSRTENSKCAT